MKIIGRCHGLGDSIVTGPTHTNVAYLIAIA
jgi:glycerate-2-kinase